MTKEKSSNVAGECLVVEQGGGIPERVEKATDKIGQVAPSMAKHLPPTPDLADVQGTLSPKAELSDVAIQTANRLAKVRDEKAVKAIKHNYSIDVEEYAEVLPEETPDARFKEDYPEADESDFLEYLEDYAGSVVDFTKDKIRWQVTLGDIDEISPMSIAYRKDAGVTEIKLATYSDGSPYVLDKDLDDGQVENEYTLICDSKGRAFLVNSNRLEWHEDEEAGMGSGLAGILKAVEEGTTKLGEWKDIDKDSAHIVPKGGPEVPPYELSEEEASALAELLTSSEAELVEAVDTGWALDNFYQAVKYYRLDKEG